MGVRDLKFRVVIGFFFQELLHCLYEIYANPYILHVFAETSFVDIDVRMKKGHWCVFEIRHFDTLQGVSKPFRLYNCSDIITSVKETALSMPRNPVVIVV